jgi:hypothetical protein
VLRVAYRFRRAPPQPALESSTPSAAPVTVGPQSRE